VYRVSGTAVTSAILLAERCEVDHRAGSSVVICKESSFRAVAMPGCGAGLLSDPFVCPGSCAKRSAGRPTSWLSSFLRLWRRAAAIATISTRVHCFVNSGPDYANETNVGLLARGHAEVL
jgi:hypothetical protein